MILCVMFRGGVKTSFFLAIFILIFAFIGFLYGLLMLVNFLILFV